MIHQAKMENYSSPPVTTVTTQQQNMNAGLNASTRSSSPVELTIHGMERDKDRATYLQQLIKDQKCCLSYPNVFHHVERLLSEEIVKVRSVLFQNNNRPLELPSPSGKTVTLSKKVFVPAKDYPDYNFVGRILGPRGLTAKQLEQETGCKIMVRGKGSMRDKKKEEQNKFKSFFSSVKKRQITVAKSENTSRWVKFEPRETQSVAPVCYRFLSYEEKNNLEQNLKNQPGSDYFTEIKNRSTYKNTKC